MPALVNNKFGASGKSDDDGTMVCFFSRKKSRNDCRIWAEVMTPELNATFHRMRELLRFDPNQTAEQKSQGDGLVASENAAATLRKPSSLTSDTNAKFLPPGRQCSTL